ncbi:PadR family transcriptional regulator [Geodermatophilus sabuli]|uniref:Transcriptional regulator, PadR family n=1 Tax=Geodermatophilus sabuli TaxID=1564158 RepID=A0A285EJ03_9ACTN|nr:PadR family transcriptional regulator [Geodermatophilus sabuli]MBB3085789.1 DNA-binding PadR family transcriptional regulator [Geodermatophilus sabuli]SNX99000.1 transcriptional regulator, PadR family [Geodermatophilus sabuli]
MREFQRGVIRVHVLHHAEEEEIHGAWMTEELARHGYRISPGTLYPTLHRLEADGLLTSRQVVVDGRTRRLYRATDAGRAALAEDRAALAELAREVLGPHRSQWPRHGSTPADDAAAPIGNSRTSGGRSSDSGSR